MPRTYDSEFRRRVVELVRYPATRSPDQPNGGSCQQRPWRGHPGWARSRWILPPVPRNISVNP